MSPHPLPEDDAMEPVSTRLESVEEIRRALNARKAGAPIKAPVRTEEAAPFRPTRRPPVAMLCILDDLKEDGEWIRLRRDRILIGRVEGEVVIPHDTMMSSRHAELSRRVEGGRCRWILTDLQSTNGTYVRVGSAVLKPDQEILIGSRCYRFETAAGRAEGAGKKAKNARNVQPVSTVSWQGVSAADLVPSLVELTSEGEGQRFLLNQPDNLMGSDPACGVRVAEDPFVSPQHAQIHQDAKGKWHVENNKSVNGIWLRVQKVPLEGTCLFQLGEQRFLFRDQ